MPQAPLFFNTEHVQVALSGTQYKAAICLIDGKVAIPEKGCFSTHIFKPGIGMCDAQILNEYFCMRLAWRLQIHVATVSLHKAVKTNFLLVKRFDREIQGHKVKHIHQEDFCQALGILPSAKYQQDGGPGFKSCFGLIQKANIPALDRIHFMKLIIFNYLIGNYHAHGKDLAILYLSAKQFQLAPFYDLQCSAISDTPSKMAMKIGGVYAHDEVKALHWQKLCHKRGFSFPAFKVMMQQQIDTILDVAKEERLLLKESGFDTDVADKIIKVIQKNCRHGV